MTKQLEVDENIRNRANEIRFRNLIIKMLNNANNNFDVINKHIVYLATILSFDKSIILDIVKDIINDRYKPTVNELIKINLLFGLTIKEIANKLNMNISTVKMHIYRNKYNINEVLLYPRLQDYQLKELRNFLKQYYRLYVPINQFAIC